MRTSIEPELHEHTSKPGNFDSSLCVAEQLAPIAVCTTCAAISPTMDTSETTEVIAYAFELAGVHRADVDVSLGRDLLCVSAHRALDDGAHEHLERMVLLPEGLDVDDVAMKFADGILVVKIAKDPERSMATHVLHS